MSRKMIDYKVEDGKIVSIDGYEVGGGGGYKIKQLTITANGVYDGEFEAYKPVFVSVPQTAQGGSLRAFLDGTKSASYLFKEYNGTSIDGLIIYSDTANVINMNNMFTQCPNLTTIPELDTSKVTDMSYMFVYCNSLTTIPVLDTSKVTNMNSMFQNCPNLTTIPELDTSKVTDMGYMFSNCPNLTSIPSLDASNVNSTNSMFYKCFKLTSIGLYGFTRSIDITNTALEHDALVAFLNQAGTARDNSQRITMGSTKLALLSNEEKAIATNKGWTLA